MNDTTHFTTGDGCRIAYRIDGPSDLPVLALSNSIATNLHMWDGQIAELTRVFRVLRYDTRGHGNSDAPPGAYSLDRLGHDMLELLDFLDISRIHFCGLSLGGYVGQWLGIYASERLDRLVLSNTSPYLGPASRWDDAIRTVLEAPELSATAEMFLRNWFPQSMFESDPAQIDTFRAMILSTPPAGLAGCWAVVRDSDLRRTVALIERPTLVIGGRDDTVTLPSHSEAIAAAIPGAQLRILPGVHMLNVEQPDEFLQTLTGFLHGRAAGGDNSAIPAAERGTFNGAGRRLGWRA